MTLLSEWISLYHRNEQRDQQHHENYGYVPNFYYHKMYNTKE